MIYRTARARSPLKNGGGPAAIVADADRIHKGLGRRFDRWREQSARTARPGPIQSGSLGHLAVGPGSRLQRPQPACQG